jgi:leucyl aminopeptidase
MSISIQFASQRGTATALVLPIAAGGLDRIDAAGLEPQVTSLVGGAARAGKFDGEAGSMAEIFVPGEGDSAGRVILLGIGDGEGPALEKAGGALTGRFLLSGLTDLTVDFTGTAVSARAIARFAATAAQRGWRQDGYRTKMPEKSKPTLTGLTIVGAPEGIDDAFVAADAITKGLDLTRTLVTDPPNILYPVSFVEKCRELEALGVELTILDERQMAELGMGALLGVGLGSEKESRLLAMRWNGKGRGRCRPRAGRQGRDLRHRRYLAQARARHGRHEVGHGRRGRRRRRDEGAGQPQGEGERRRRGRAGREHARWQGAASG